MSCTRYYNAWGSFRSQSYALLAPVIDFADGELRTLGYIPPSLESVIPGLAESPFMAFLVYLVILDFADYWRHRFQHRWGRWRVLHDPSITASAKCRFGRDDRNHLL